MPDLPNNTNRIDTTGLTTDQIATLRKEIILNYLAEGPQPVANIAYHLGVPMTEAALLCDALFENSDVTRDAVSDNATYTLV